MSTGTAAAAEPRIRAHGTVRVSLPAKVAYTPEALKKTIGGLLEHLGCPKCFSGADCHFTMERQYIVDAKGSISPGSSVEINPQPLPPRESSATVSLTRAARYDINAVYKAVDSVIHNLGPCPCHSGFDVAYLNEIRVIGINEKGEAMQFGG